MIPPPNSALKLLLFTDPICSTCWAFSPYLRKLEQEYGHLIEIEYKMGGLLESWETYKDKSGKVKHPSDLIDLWNTLGKESGMSMDGDFWKEEGISSSYPPSLAFYAIKKLAPSKATIYLRKLREGLFLKNKNISSRAIQIETAESVGVDPESFKREVSSLDNLRMLYQDIKAKNEFGIESLPCLVLLDKSGKYIKLQTEEGYEKLVAVVSEQLSMKIPKAKIPHSIPRILRRYGLLSTKEIAVLLNEEESRASSQLHELRNHGKIVSEDYKHGTFWKSPADTLFKNQRGREKTEVAIIGAGIAGLSLAIHLKKSGTRIRIIEKSAEFTSQGLGFLIMPNGIKMIREMGLEQEFLQKSNRIDHIRLLNLEGIALENRPIEPCYGISRQNCITILRNHLGADTIDFKKEIKGMHKGPSGRINELTLNDGSSLIPDLIVACDGGRSRLRKMMFPGCEFRKVQESELVCIVKAPELAARLGHTFLKVVCPELGFNMGIVHSGEGNLIWFIQINAKRQALPANDPVDIACFVRALKPSLPPDFQTAIELSDLNNVYLWEMHDMDLLPSFHKNGILLIGDSAHPLLSFTSQGASSAMEDGYFLAKLLREKHTYKNQNELYDAFYDSRKDAISHFIDGGRMLLDQFLHPENHETTNLPFLNYGNK
jgi:2-polyprenyl-6-methoxyphenol hydroxylase-like FAD-dependent oxidoreductase/predicted DsbA family dithiol-disulfide isomerase